MYGEGWVQVRGPSVMSCCVTCIHSGMHDMYSQACMACTLRHAWHVHSGMHGMFFMDCWLTCSLWTDGLHVLYGLLAYMLFMDYWLTCSSWIVGLHALHGLLAYMMFFMDCWLTC